MGAGVSRVGGVGWDGWTVTACRAAGIIVHKAHTPVSERPRALAGRGGDCLVGRCALAFVGNDAGLHDLGPNSSLLDVAC